MRKAILAFLIFVSYSAVASSQIRKVIVKEDDILTVKTALGIATIIQLPDPIQSAIIGDQSGFKIEYLDRAVTIKPLRWGAKTNLYLVTEKRRYNVKLHTGQQEVADYIVYVRNPEISLSTVKWVSVGKYVLLDGMKLTVDRVGKTASGFLLLEASLTVTTTQPSSIKPGEIWVKQNGNSKVINSLFLSDLKFKKNAPLRIGISLAKSDLVQGKPVTLEVRGQKVLVVQVAEGFLWK